jgi:glycosyltransferase involved in cell wall biosynthesis
LGKTYLPEVYNAVRILVLTTEAYGGHGGIAQYGRDLLRELAAMPRVTELVVLPRSIKMSVGDLPERIVYRVHAAKGKVYFIGEALRASLGSFDLVVCGHINLLPLAVLVNCRIRAPLVLMVYGIDVWEPHRLPTVRRLLGRVTRFWSISEVTRDKMCKWSAIPPDRFSLLPNGIDIDYYGSGPKNPVLIERYGLTGHRVLLLLARLVSPERYKGVDEVLAVLPALLQRMPDIKFVIAGHGDDQARLEQKAIELGFANHVVFTGYVPESEKRDLYRIADLFVMPGRGEGFGFVFLEAMACGVPVVASTLDGSREAVRNGEIGRLVDPRDLAALEAAIIGGLGDPKGVPAGLEYFSFPKFQQRLETALKEAME